MNISPPPVPLVSNRLHRWLSTRFFLFSFFLCYFVRENLEQTSSSNRRTNDSRLLTIIIIIQIFSNPPATTRKVKTGLEIFFGLFRISKCCSINGQVCIQYPFWMLYINNLHICSPRSPCKVIDASFGESTNCLFIYLDVWAGGNVNCQTGWQNTKMFPSFATGRLLPYLTESPIFGL